jgi:carboxypeptidase family protein
MFLACILLPSPKFLRPGLDGIECGVSRLLRVQKPDFFPSEVPVLILGDTQRNVTIDRLAYSLQGFVRESPSGPPLVSATVEVVSGPYAGRQGTTHADGSYFLQVRDTVTVRASKPGYVSEDATVTVAGPAATYKDFSLRRKASAP